jgi:predicted RNA-binding protein
MCLAKLYLPGDDKIPVAENVTRIYIKDGEIEVETLFGEKQTFTGKIRRINFADSKVQLEDN